MKNYLLMTIKWDHGKPINVDLLAQKLNVAAGDFDEDFGIVSVDNEDNIYSYRISEEGFNKSNIADKKEFEGPYSDTRIEPFGLE